MDRGVLPKSWKRHEYNGLLLRSKWEVEVAKLLDLLCIKYEYERKDTVTKTRPDFYFPQLDRYLEIHPDIYGQKPYIPNQVIVKTKEHALYSVLAIGFKINPDAAKSYLSSTRSLEKHEKAMMSLAMYLKQALMERDNS